MLTKLLTVIVLIICSNAVSAMSESEIEQLIDQSALKYKIPPMLFKALITHESCLPVKQQCSIWPWTLNNAGIHQHFLDQVSAATALKELIANGEMNVDIGLAQINWKWHGNKSLNPDYLLDPAVNIEVAAKLLANHFKKSQNWLEAIGYYHTFRHAKAKQYAMKVIGHL